jgi:hypothetical protein
MITPHNNGDSMNFNFELIVETGTEIVADAPTLSNNPIWLKVYGHDSGGIWVESEKLSETARDTLKDKSEADKSVPIFFVPYSAIRFAVVRVPKEASFLKEPPVRVLT